MSNVTSLGRPSPEVVLHEALECVEDMECLVIAYIDKEHHVNRVWTVNQTYQLHSMVMSLLNATLCQFEDEP